MPDPVYGSLPGLASTWAVVGVDPAPSFTAEQMREQLRVLLDLPLAFYELSKLSEAMNGAAELSPEAVARVKADAIEWQAIEEQVAAIRREPTESGLPLIQADVVKYSEEPLKGGHGIAGLRTQPLADEQARISRRIAQALSICLYLPTARGCGGHGRSGSTRLYRS